MFEIADRLLPALGSGRPLAIATAVSIDGSAPRTIGTSMAFDGERVIGSIAGGCVEGAVVQVCEEVLDDGVERVVEYGVSDETAFSVGLTCGGRLRIHVRLASGADREQLALAAAGEPAGVALRIAGPEGHRERIDAELAARIALGETALSAIDCDGEVVETFFEVSVPAPRMIVFGAMEFSAALANASRMLGYRTTVVDPRPLFATAVRFPGCEVVVTWPTVWLERQSLDARDAVCVLSHDARFDAELIALALDTPAGFVGAMGSRTTHDRRMASLRERGVPPEHLERLHSPIGLDIGASTVEETAIAILAEVIAVRNGSSGAHLRATDGPIHRARA